MDSLRLRIYLKVLNIIPFTVLRLTKNSRLLLIDNFEVLSFNHGMSISAIL